MMMIYKMGMYHWNTDLNVGVVCVCKCQKVLSDLISCLYYIFVVHLIKCQVQESHCADEHFNFNSFFFSFLVSLCKRVVIFLSVVVCIRHYDNAFLNVKMCATGLIMKSFMCAHSYPFKWLCNSKWKLSMWKIWIFFWFVFEEILNVPCPPCVDCSLHPFTMPNLNLTFDLFCQLSEINFRCLNTL